jgi:hypothetical protein
VQEINLFLEIQMPLPFKLSEINFEYDLKDCKFEMDAIQDQMINYYLQNDLRFRRAFHTDFTMGFLKMFQDKAKLKEPTSLSCSGHTRGGKSSSMMTIAIIQSALYGRTFTIDYVCGNKIDFLNRLRDMSEEQTQNSVFLVDEDKTLQGYGSISKKMGLQDIQNITAKYNVNTINICPTRFANESADYGIRVMGRDMAHGLNRFMLYNLQEGSRGGVLPMGMVYIPIFTKVFPKEYIEPLEKAYLLKKDEWIKQEIEGSGNDVLAEMRLKVARKFSSDEIYKTLGKKEKFTYISQKLGGGYSVGEINDIVNLTSLIDKGAISEDE